MIDICEWLVWQITLGSGFGYRSANHESYKLWTNPAGARYSACCTRLWIGETWILSAYVSLCTTLLHCHPVWVALLDTHYASATMAWSTTSIANCVGWFSFFPASICGSTVECCWISRLIHIRFRYFFCVNKLSKPDTFAHKNHNISTRSSKLYSCID